MYERLRKQAKLMPFDADAFLEWVNSRPVLFPLANTEWGNSTARALERGFGKNYLPRPSRGQAAIGKNKKIRMSHGQWVACGKEWIYQRECSAANASTLLQRHGTRNVLWLSRAVCVLDPACNARSWWHGGGGETRLCSVVLAGCRENIEEWMPWAP